MSRENLQSIDTPAERGVMYGLKRVDNLCISLIGVLGAAVLRHCDAIKHKCYY